MASPSPTVALFREETGAFDAQTASIQVTKPYSRTQAAKFLGVHWETVGVMIRDGRLATVQIGKRKKVLGAEILRFLGASAPPPPATGTLAERNKRAKEIVEELMKKYGPNR